jgi:hypothetical protein
MAVTRGVSLHFLLLVSLAYCVQGMETHGIPNLLDLDGRRSRRSFLLEHVQCYNVIFFNHLLICAGFVKCVARFARVGMRVGDCSCLVRLHTSCRDRALCRCRYSRHYGMIVVLVGMLRLEPLYIICSKAKNRRSARLHSGRSCHSSYALRRHCYTYESVVCFPRPLISYTKFFTASCASLHRIV